MSEQPTPGIPEATAARRPETLTPAVIEEVLNDFRAWLHEAASRDDAIETAEPTAEHIDLHTLLAQFTALRHEVNLQTRAVRAQQEQNAQTLLVLRQCLESAPPSPSPPTQEDDDSIRTNLRTLIEIHDALALAAREAQRMRETVLPNLDQMAAERPAESALAPPQRSFLARLFGGAESASVAALQRELAVERERLNNARQNAGRIRGMLESLVTGYTMSLQRLERALRQAELEPIPCVGGAFDPEQMEAVEIVSGSGRPSGVVVDEVRRGYLWRGRVFRYAQVRVAKD